MIRRFSRTVAAERTDGSPAAALRAVWPWRSANVMTTETVKLMKVFPLPEPDIILIIVPFNSHLSWHIVSYVCK